MARAGRPQPDRSLYSSLYQLLANFYFMDPLHLTPEGHERVAEVLAYYLADQGLVKIDREALTAHGHEIRECGVAGSGRVLMSSCHRRARRCWTKVRPCTRWAATGRR